MAVESSGEGVVASAAAEGREAPRLSRRQAIAGLSAVASAGVAAWVVPEILTAKPAAGAVLSGTTEEGTANLGAIPATTASAAPSEPGASLAGALAFTGLDLKRDAEVGAALVAGGWAMQHWASRPSRAAPSGTPGPAPGGTSSAPAE